MTEDNIRCPSKRQTMWKQMESGQATDRERLRGTYTDTVARSPIVRPSLGCHCESHNEQPQVDLPPARSTVLPGSPQIVSSPKAAVAWPGVWC
jgi:hypothetical protein